MTRLTATTPTTEDAAKGVFNALVNSTGFSNFVKTYNSGTIVFLTIATFLTLIALIINIVKLAGSGGNAMLRTAAIQNVTVTGLCFGALVGIDVLYITLVGVIIG